MTHVHHWLLAGADTAEKLPGEEKPRIWGRCKNPKCPVKRRRFNPVGWDEHQGAATAQDGQGERSAETIQLAPKLTANRKGGGQPE